MATVFRRHGFEIQYVDASSPSLADPALRHADILAVMGGPFGANDDVDYPFLSIERDLVARRIDQGRMTLGVCLGAQIMARALGASVYAGAELELGWGTLTLSDAGRASLLLPLDAADTRVLHWHGETFDLPNGATRLASTSICANQAFTVGGVGLGLQFHAEVDETSMPRWIQHPRIAPWLAMVEQQRQLPPGSLPQALVEDGRRYGRRLALQTAGVLDSWLQNGDRR